MPLNDDLVNKVYQNAAVIGDTMFVILEGSFVIAHTYYFECRGGKQGVLNNGELLMDCLQAMAQMNDLIVVAQAQHHFTPTGISIVLVLAESHLAIHTWPEEGSAYILLSSCKKLNKEALISTHEFIATNLGFTVANARELT